MTEPQTEPQFGAGWNRSHKVGDDLGMENMALGIEALGSPHDVPKHEDCCMV